MLPICLVRYGWYRETDAQRIIDAEPEYVISATPAGPWHGDCPVAEFATEGIKVLSYLWGGFEGTATGEIPCDLASNLAFIEALRNESGTYGIFLDCVSPYPTEAGFAYLEAIWNAAQAAGLEVFFNINSESWDARLMDYCHVNNTCELWNDNPVTASEAPFLNRLMVLTHNPLAAPIFHGAAEAAALTKAAWNKGFRLHYACDTYSGELPVWFEDYIELLKFPAPTPSLVGWLIPATLVGIVAMAIISGRRR